MLACLCQGSAQHYVHQNRGVQDFDIWFFFQKSDGPDFPHRRRGKVDFGPSRFGANPEDRGFKGRRVDVIGRSIAADDLAPTAAVIRYLEGAATSSAWHLAQRPVVVVSPGVDFGRVIWDGLNNEPWVRTDG